MPQTRPQARGSPAALAPAGRAANAAPAAPRLVQPGAVRVGAWRRSCRDVPRGACRASSHAAGAPPDRHATAWRFLAVESARTRQRRHRM